MKFISTTPVEQVEINLTPLIDVVFLLLIFFMVSTTFDTTSELKIKLPQASQDSTINKPRKLNLLIDAKGNFYLNSRELVDTRSATLKAALERARLFELLLEARHVADVLVGQSPQFDAALDEREQHLAVEGLEQEIEGLLPDRADELLVRLDEAARHQDDVEPGPRLSKRCNPAKNGADERI